MSFERGPLLWLPVRFQADADFNANIPRAAARREPAIDCRSAVAANLHHRPDREVIAIAAADGRLLLTHDHRTMPAAFADHLRDHESTGVLIVPQHLPIDTVAEDLVLIWALSDPGEWRNRIAWLPL